MERTEVAAKIKAMLVENLRIPEEILEEDSELFGVMLWNMRRLSL